MDDDFNPEDIQRVYSQLQEIVEQLRHAGAKLPDNLETLLQSGGFPADIPFDRTQQSSASVTRAESAVHADSSWMPSLEHILTQGTATIEDQFTVDPSDRGGQAAGKGFEFQDLYTTFLMTKFLDEDAPAVLMRVEGAEDVDLLTKHSDNICERYYQIKTIKEGKNWTLRMFDTEGVWWRFAYCVSQFLSKCSDPNRSIQVALVVDGDVNEDIQTLRDTPKAFSISEHLRDTALVDQPLMETVRAETLFSIVRQYLLLHYSNKEVRNALRSRASDCTKRLEELCSTLIPVLDSGLLKTMPQLDGDVSASGVELVGHLVQAALQADDLRVLTAEVVHDFELLESSPDHLEALQTCLIKAYRLLDPLFASLRIESLFKLEPGQTSSLRQIPPLSRPHNLLGAPISRKEYCLGWSKEPISPQHKLGLSTSSSRDSCDKLRRLDDLSIAISSVC
jgi:hypothetical protein